MKKKVKIICECYPTTFEHHVNEFLTKHGDHVLDIQYQINSSGWHCALITYEEW